MSEITQFITTRKEGRTVRHGVLVADRVGDQAVVGWSLCHLNRDDFSRETALKIARDRLQTVARHPKRGHTLVVPQTVQHHLKSFEKRCERYFKIKPEVFGHAQESTEQESTGSTESKGREGDAGVHRARKDGDAGFHRAKGRDDESSKS